MVQIARVLASLTFVVGTNAAVVSAVECGEGQTAMSVEGASGDFCVPSGHECVASILGDCPRSQSGLEFGSYCGIVASGVLGCKALDSESVATYHPTLNPTPRCRDEEVEVSVEGILNSYCVRDGYVCSGARGDGDCPGPQLGLPFGSYCDIVKSGVYGCKPKSGNESAVYESSKERNCTGSPFGETAVSVEKVGTFCASGTICTGKEFGNCPLIQDGLLVNSSCVVVSTGVFGCAVI